MFKYFCFVVFVLAFAGCEKADKYLDVKLNNSDVTPSTLDHFQGILDDQDNMNFNFMVAGITSSDNVFVFDDELKRLTEIERNLYQWTPKIWPTDFSGDWASAYKRIFSCNAVIELLDGKTPNPADQQKYDKVMGTALFHRAYQYYLLAQAFCVPYSTDNLQSNGIGLRLTSNIKAVTKRVSIKDSYNQILSDLRRANRMLPVVQQFKLQPIKGASLALTAKVFLNMGAYDSVAYYCDAALALNSTLLDFNTLNVNALIPFPNGLGNHPEVLFYAMNSFTFTASPFGYGNVDSILFRSYDANDLRRAVFFYADTKYKGHYKHKGGYSGTHQGFAGMATNEVYYMKIEALAMQEKDQQALDLLNQVLSKRYKAGFFTPLVAASHAALLELIWRERRKEFPNVGLLRWEDIRRLNALKLKTFDVTRIVNGQVIRLESNGKRYALPVPNDEVRLFNMEQNPR